MKVPLAALLDPAYHRTLAARIDASKVLPPDSYGLGGRSAPPPRQAARPTCR